VVETGRIDWTSEDPLGAVLHSLKLSGAFYCRSELSAPWGLTMPPMPGCLWFHAVTRGGCTLEIPGGPEPLSLGPGDFVLVPRGEGHRLRTDEDVETPVVTDLPHAIEEERYALLRYGGGGEPTSLVCGIVRLADPVGQDLVEALPPCIHVNALGTPHAQWMQSSLQLMALEARGLSTGGEAIVTRLADILVIQALRAWLETETEGRPGWLGALRDPQIGRALACIHREPARSWTVASLASASAMSRSGFAARFTQLVGDAPLHYLTRARMRLARSLLEDAGLDLATVADRVGYQSEAAFSRAFKRSVGVSPGAVRRGAAE